MEVFIARSGTMSERESVTAKCGFIYCWQNMGR